MGTKMIKVEITGKSPLLMHKFPMVPIEAIEKKSPQEQAQLAAYSDEDTGELFIPGINIQRAFVSGATYSKGKRNATLQKTVAACVMIGPERLMLGTKKFSIDSRPVVIKATGGRIIRHRPRLDKWKIKFELEYEDTLLTEDQVRKVVDDTCQRVGFLDFRPEKKGPFGRAMVTSWK